MERRYIVVRNVSDAAMKLLDLILRKRDKKVIYFHGWSGFGVTPVLRSIVQNLSSMKSPAELSHHTLIYIDCSEWKSRRSLQRKIAEELKFDQTTMDIFDKQDEEDDFNGVEQSSRDLIMDVSIMIDKTLKEHNFMIFFLNGSGEEVDLTNFGVPFFSAVVNNRMVWSFKKRSLAITQSGYEQYSILKTQLRNTHLFVYDYLDIQELSNSEFSDLLHEEAASIIARHPCILGMDALTMVKDCCLYQMFLYYSFHRATEFAWVAHASNYWICDGIIKGDRAEEISNALHEETRWECDTYDLFDHVCKDWIKNHQDASFLVINDTVYKKKPYRWVALTSKNLKVPDQDMKTIMDKASSLFVAFKMTDDTPSRLPDGLFKHCNNLGVLVLFCCAFNFASPPFLQCHELRFLGLDRCTNDLTREEAEGCCMDWVFLHSLWVLDLRYTDWDEILAEGKIDLMVNLGELSIKGLKCWQYISQLQTRLSNLQRLRIIRPMQKAKISDDTSRNSFVDKTKLEVLDLSGNSDMKKLPTSLSNASQLQVLILDGCDGLENVEVPHGLPSSLTSFSLDSYGPASHYKTSSTELPPESSRPERPSDQDMKDIKTSKISLQGCKQLRNLFLRGLSNLMELDLSGSALKVLDFGSMVVDVPRLKRLFLLGCGHLRAIKWGSSVHNWELICIDTRSGTWTQPLLAQHDPCRFQVHAVLADVRLAWSLWTLINKRSELGFHIHVPSSSYTIVDCGTIQQPEATSNEMTEPAVNKLQRHCLARQYGDVLTKMGDAPTPMEAFPNPEPPRASPLDRHVEITGGGHILDSELQRRLPGPRFDGLAALMKYHAKSLHVHDASISVSMPRGRWDMLRWCRVERCPSLGPTLFPLDVYVGHINVLEVIWVSELAMARCLWSKGRDFRSLQHLCLRSCPRLQYALPFGACASLKTIDVVHCGDLRHVFVASFNRPDDAGMLFPVLATIYMHDLPMLKGICEGKKMFAPKLQAVRIRGCFGLRRLPVVEGVGWARPTVEMEKDVWDALEWDDIDMYGRHQRSYYQPLLHSRYYRRRRLLRGTVLRYVNERDDDDDGMDAARRLRTDAVLRSCDVCPRGCVALLQRFFMAATVPAFAFSVYACPARHGGLRGCMAPLP
ncbi:hypothetical protein EJB05_03333 [Eragrostis curvula]|uniref:NB-ARC domain-containing protein n=1 Tax=Eragrostis curvula TaxID=38414 RepID=A0A5J9W7J8_9POAL|nr:hypothetical protein EJB05_03333 [Eragrostis curvula]